MLSGMKRENSLLSAIEEDAVILFKYRMIIVHPQAAKLAECAAQCDNNRLLQASRPEPEDEPEVETSPRRTGNGRRLSTVSKSGRRKAGPKPVDSCFFLGQVEPEASMVSFTSSPSMHRNKVLQADMEAVSSFSENLPELKTAEEARAIALVFVIFFDEEHKAEDQSDCSLEQVFEHDPPEAQLKDVAARYHEHKMTSKVACPLALLCLNADRASETEPMKKVKSFLKQWGKDGPTVTKLFTSRSSSSTHLYEVFREISWYVEALAKAKMHELPTQYEDEEASVATSNGPSERQSSRCCCRIWPRRLSRAKVQPTSGWT
mmetsp:Transcript_25450/g.59257  ORF Transcript_25450/g.59257 Transcript_25450/m.59257 type:complete len:319 (+) Transcript_25450:85-1041(+)